MTWMASPKKRPKQEIPTLDYAPVLRSRFSPRGLLRPLLAAGFTMAAAELFIQKGGSAWVQHSLKQYHSEQKPAFDRQRSALEHAFSNGTLSSRQFKKKLSALNEKEKNLQNAFLRKKFGLLTRLQHKRSQYLVSAGVLGAGIAIATQRTKNRFPKKKSRIKR